MRRLRQRFLARLAFGDLCAVVGPSAGVLGDLADGDHVQRVVELTIPSPREPVAHHLPAGGLDRRRASMGGEVALVREAASIADPPDDLRRQDRSEAVDLRERGRAFFDSFRDAPVELTDLAVQPSQISQEVLR